METPLVLLLIFSVSALSATVSGVCICNKAAGNSPVFDQDHEQQIGELKPNDCKPYANQSNVDQYWFGIQFNGQVGYVTKQSGIVIDLCTKGQNEGSVGPTDFPLTDTPVHVMPVQVVNNTVITNITYITNITNIVNTNTNTNTGNNTHVHGTITLSNALRGNTKLCPQYVIQGAHKNGYVLTQHGHACYEICTDMVSWNRAQTLCKERGGHLVTIHNNKENTYLQQLLSHTHHHRVWIGLNDKANEEQFQWVTGEKDTYTNWRPHHRKSSDHNHEDCVVMSSAGYWDDVSCESHAATHHHDYICEYGVHNGAHIIG
ncbi:uncharacterized protein LOC132713263 [Ruditapes philippinarum]|uniref:uncharacterized protein LOC132713263 n=1 Tax=Ruditapes philippinarum TaxID=129788 RepID=UPI00295C0F57|nr:uncharacterized protein LOC132713263 [Ruditapes philippinarum]